MKKKKPSATRGPRRPPVAGEPHFVRLTDDLLRRIEKHRLAMEAKAEGGVTKSDAVRDLIIAGLLVRDLVDLLPTCDAEPPRGSTGANRPRPATRGAGYGRRHCDIHAVENSWDLPYASVLRKLVAR